MKYLLVATMALVLAACGSKTDDEGSAPTSSTTGQRAPGGAGEAVAAVLDSQGTPLVQLRFVIDTRPVVRTPFRLQLIATATAPVPGLHMTAESPSMWIDSAETELDLVQEGDGSGESSEFTATHELFVTSRETGLVEMAVHLTAGADTPETVYLIPILVASTAAGAEAPAAASDKSDPATEADHGQP